MKKILLFLAILAIAFNVPAQENKGKTVPIETIQADNPVNSDDAFFKVYIWTGGLYWSEVGATVAIALQATWCVLHNFSVISSRAWYVEGWQGEGNGWLAEVKYTDAPALTDIK